MSRTAASKEDLRSAASIHMIHGCAGAAELNRDVGSDFDAGRVDVARAILAMHQASDSVYNQRWLITDRVYLDLIYVIH